MALVSLPSNEVTPSLSPLVGVLSSSFQPPSHTLHTSLLFTLLFQAMTSHVLSHSRLATLPPYQLISTSRLKSLYSDFLRQKHSNPTSYTSNVEWWRRTLEAVLLAGWQSQPSSTPDRLVLHASGSSLADEFRYEGIGKPLSLAGVIVGILTSYTIVSS